VESGAQAQYPWKPSGAKSEVIPKTANLPPPKTLHRKQPLRQSVMLAEFSDFKIVVNGATLRSVSVEIINRRQKPCTFTKRLSRAAQ